MKTQQTVIICVALFLSVVAIVVGDVLVQRDVALPAHKPERTVLHLLPTADTSLPKRQCLRQVLRDKQASPTFGPTTHGIGSENAATLRRRESDLTSTVTNRVLQH